MSYYLSQRPDTTSGPIERDKVMTSVEIANIILSQLGGNRFIAMTGAKNFVALESGLQFDLPKTPHYVKDGISRLHVVLTPADTYTVKAFKIRGINCKQLSEQESIYCDMLQITFTKLTGLNTYL